MENNGQIKYTVTGAPPETLVNDIDFDSFLKSYMEPSTKRPLGTFIEEFDDEFMRDFYNKDPYTHAVINALIQGKDIYKILQEVLKSRRELVEQNTELQFKTMGFHL